MPALQTVTYNLAIPDHFRIVASNLGGEDMMRRKYPELFKILMYSRSAAERKASNAQLLRACRSTQPGFVDYTQIRTLDCAMGKVSSTADMGTVSEMPTLAIIGEIKDVCRGISVGSCAVCDSDSHYLDSAMEAPAASEENYDYIAETTFTKIEYDQEGNPVINSTTATQETTAEGAVSNIVKNLLVTDPMPNITKGDETVIFYNNRKGPGCDYYYDNVSQYDDHVRIMIPFSGSVEFNPPFKPVYVDKNNGLTLRIETQTNGAIQFGMEGWNKIKWTADDCRLSWQFPADWNNYIYKSGVKQVNHVDFYCRMAVNYSLAGGANAQNIVPIIISSMDDTVGGSVLKIPRIDIQWGCFAKNTRIKMADGSYKCIQTINPGERVRTESGTARVMEIIVGEERRITVISTSGGKTIKVSYDHPVLTQSGWKAADCLTAADVLRTEQGGESIEALYTENYNDKVFSLKTDGDGSLIADGIFAGDFGQQNKVQKPAGKPLNEFQQEFADLIQNIAKNKEERLG